jgi:hypothetical protein
MYNLLIENLNEKTMKPLCECALKPMLKKYEQYNSYLPEHEQREFTQKDINFQFAFTCLVLNLKLRNKPKKGKNQPIKTDINFKL